VASLKIKDDKLNLTATDMQINLCKQIPGMSYSRSESAWVGPLSPLAVNVAWDIFGGLEVSEEITTYMQRETKNHEFLQKIKHGGGPDLPESVAEGLWPLQHTGVRHLVAAQEAYLCDEMGSGKTIQCYRALDYIGDAAFPVFVVANKSALHSVWEAESHWSKLTEEVHVIEGTAAKRRKGFQAAVEAIAGGKRVVVVLGWGGLVEHSRLSPYGNVALTDKERTPKELNSIEFRTCIIDEAHKAKNWKAKRTRALWQVAHDPNVIYRWGLTGTPITGYEEDVWGIGHAIQPDTYPRKTQWLDRYVDIRTAPGQNYPIVVGFRPERYQEMIDHLDPYMLRRTKDEIIPDYQGKLPLRTIYTEMNAQQKKSYKQMYEHMLVASEDKILAAPSPIEQLLRLNQFAAATPVIHEDELGNPQVTGLKMPSCKVDALLELLEELGEEQAVVFAESKLLINLFEEQLIKHKISYVRITGDESTLQRSTNQTLFQSKEVRVALCTYAAGAESITLNSADTVIRTQRSYNFVLDSQAPDRVDRGSRTVPTQVIDLVTSETAEAGVHDRIQEKEHIFQQVVRDEIA